MSRIRIPLIPDPDVQDPDAGESKNRRQWPRYAFPERENFSLTADGRTVTCVIEDISLGGARLRMEGPVPGNLELRIEHPRLGHAFARRCWKAKHHLGVIFDHSEPSLAFIADCVAEGSAIAVPPPAD
jgi:hypothetical protein